ncbi:SAM hydrolase/SAM-dependent halogenase family protein [Olivibacter sitiensis]|uniref:SAM hydrolase/SAM-dependent halogenase family protein n=1 Tax=Olivibacter sitiensis TaxID=376470 RepID=UPI0003F88ACF|nr:SAM-dependent chlorinase/fluorinase [Olivibacter sitiensis]
MGIITLTTDLGYKDFYQAALKGSIISLYPNAQLIDISHNIAPFNIQQAAFVLKNAYRFFPDETVHLIGIESVFSENVRYVAIRHENHYFVGADSGIFSLIFECKPDEIVELNIVQDLKFLHFPLTDIFAKAASHLAQGGKLGEIGDPIDDIVLKNVLQPTITDNTIRGSVIYIDSFENIITNISKELFNKVQKGRNFELAFRRNETIKNLSWHYNEVENGEKLCLFGISNHLEIALNRGKAAGLLGMGLNDTILVTFFNKRD